MHIGRIGGHGGTIEYQYRNGRDERRENHCGRGEYLLKGKPGLKGKSAHLEIMTLKLIMCSDLVFLVATNYGLSVLVTTPLCVCIPV